MIAFGDAKLSWLRIKLINRDYQDLVIIDFKRGIAFGDAKLSWLRIKLINRDYQDLVIIDFKRLKGDRSGYIRSYLP